MIRHVSLLTLAPETTVEDIESIVEQLEGLAGTIPTLRSLAVGADLGLAEGNASIAVTADFDDVHGFATYRDDADHQRILNDAIRPRLVARSVAQFQL